MSEVAATQSTPPRQKLSRPKRALFRLLCLFLPFLCLACVEGILRLANLGGHPPIIRRVGPVEQGTLLITDPAGARSFFFANPQRPGYNEQYSFIEPKAAGVVRIVVV